MGGKTHCKWLTSFAMPIVSVEAKYVTLIVTQYTAESLGSHTAIFGISTFFDHSNTTISTFQDQFRRNGMRPRGWRVGFPASCHCSEHSRFSLAPSVLRWFGVFCAASIS
jgi:hypothetical protein